MRVRACSRIGVNFIHLTLLSFHLLLPLLPALARSLARSRTSCNNLFLLGFVPAKVGNQIHKLGVCVGGGGVRWTVSWRRGRRNKSKYGWTAGWMYSMVFFSIIRGIVG